LAESNFTTPTIEEEMANPLHFKIILQGVSVWNQWRLGNPSIEPDLRGANLAGLNLSEVDFLYTSLNAADLNSTDLRESIFACADFTAANLSRADLSRESPSAGGPGSGTHSAVFASCDRKTRISQKRKIRITQG